MNKKKILLIVFAIIIVAVGIVTAVVPQKEKEMDPEEFLERFEQAAEEVLGEDIQQISKTELVATLTYGHETDKDNNIYYRILKTTYGEAGDPSSVTGLNTDALNVLFPVDMMDSCEEMMIQDWHTHSIKRMTLLFCVGRLIPKSVMFWNTLRAKCLTPKLLKWLKVQHL